MEVTKSFFLIWSFPATFSLFRLFNTVFNTLDGK